MNEFHHIFEAVLALRKKYHDEDLPDYDLKKEVLSQVMSTLFIDDIYLENSTIPKGYHFEIRVPCKDNKIGVNNGYQEKSSIFHLLEELFDTANVPLSVVAGGLEGPIPQMPNLHYWMLISH